MGHPLCIVILGPTCSWKSDVALRLAESAGGEIVSCDSMQIYRGLPIGTAQPSPDCLRRVPHHLIAELSIQEPYDANRFIIRAKAAIQSISSRGRMAFMAGGTGLYARSLIYGFELLPSDPSLFTKLEAECSEPGGRERLMRRLENACAGTVIPTDVRQNPRRLLRACEVVELTGKPPWLLHRKNDQPDDAYRQYCLIPNFGMLKERIRRRTAEMLSRGWIDEAARAERDGLMETPTARQALGYSEIIAYLHGGMKGGVAALTELLSNRTIQYARRQLTWFRHQHPGSVQIAIDTEERAVETVLERIRQDCGSL